MHARGPAMVGTDHERTHRDKLDPSSPISERSDRCTALDVALDGYMIRRILWHAQLESLEMMFNTLSHTFIHLADPDPHHDAIRHRPLRLAQPSVERLRSGLEFPGHLLSARLEVYQLHR